MFTPNTIQNTMLRVCYQALAVGITVTPTTIVSTAFTWSMLTPRWYYPPRYPGTPADINSVWADWYALEASGLVPAGAVKGE